MGSLGLKDGPLSQESPNGLDLLRATREIDSALGLRFLPGRCGTAVTLGAVGTNLVSIRERLADWRPDLVHGAWLGYEDVSRSVESLSRLSMAERREIVGLEPGREATIHSGALILERCLFALGAEGCRVSVRGWRHAWLELLFTSSATSESRED